MARQRGVRGGRKDVRVDLYKQGFLSFGKVLRLMTPIRRFRKRRPTEAALCRSDRLRPALPASRADAQACNHSF